MAKVEEYQQMMAWLTRPKSKFQEPRIMDQAALTDDLEPGALKDEMLKDFDPSQETYEEYLQRKSLERPFNMNQGGRIGFAKAGFVKPLDKEQQKVWNELNPDLKWEDYKGNRGNWRFDSKRKKKILDETRGLISEEKLAEILTEELGEEISRAKIFGKYGVGQRTKFAETIDNLLFKGKFGSITSTGTGGGSVRYFKKPSKSDIKKILKSETLGDVRINTLKSNTVKNINYLNKKYGDIYKAGNIPDIETVMKGTKMTEQSAGTATARLAQIYNGHKFKNKQLEGIRVNKNTASKMFEIMDKSPFGNPYRNSLYKISLATIDEKLGNEKGTFEGLKKKATQILKDNNIPVYDFKKGDKAFGFNINEIAGVTGSAKSKAAEFSQFIDIMEGNLNQKTLANFQGQLSIARQNIENNPNMLSSESKRINKLARNLEKQYDVALPRLKDPDAARYFSPTRLKQLKDQGLDIVKAAERAGYTVQMPKGAITAKEFTELDNKKMLKFFKDAGIPCIKGVGGQCTSIVDYQKGFNQIVDEAAAGKGSAKAINKLGKFTKGIRALGNVGKWTGYGLLAEAGFMVPFAVGDYAAGKKWSRIIGNATDYGFGPILGQSEQEEFEAALPEGSAAPQAENVMELGERLYGMEQQKVNPGYGRVGYRKRAEDARQNVYDNTLDQYLLNIQPFIRPNPQLEEGQFYDQGLMDKAMQEGVAAREKIRQEDLIRKQQRDIGMPMDFMAAGGGIAGIRRPHAIPPKSGPTPQGLPSMYNRVKRI